MSLVWDNFTRGGSDKLALLAMADWCNDQGGSLHPSVSTVAKKINRTEKQAREILHRLISEGWLAVIGNENGGNPGQSRQYQINVEKLSTPNVDVTPPASVTPNVDVRDPSRQRSFTPNAGVSLTTIEPPRTTSKSLRRKSAPIPADFQINEVSTAYADARRLNVKNEFVAFTNWHTAKGSTFKDWQAAWRTWCDKAVEFGRAKGQAPPSKQANRDSYDMQAQEAAERIFGHGRPTEIDITPPPG